MNSRTLGLIDVDTGEKFQVKFQLSRDLELLPLEICIIFQTDVSSSENAMFGACMGIRHQVPGFVQLYYLCPVKCFRVFSSEDVENCFSTVKNVSWLENTEYAVESCKCSGSKQLSMFDF